MLNVCHHYLLRDPVISHRESLHFLLATDLDAIRYQQYQSNNLLLVANIRDSKSKQRKRK